MCTATWFFHENGYDLFFNRDELNTRKTALPPKLISTENFHYISPTDADEGGTWIAVNEFGITICLLNYYHHSMQISSDQKFKSRGHIIPQLIQHPDSVSIFDHLKKINLEEYRPFIIAIFEKGKPVTSLTWGNANKIAETKTDVQLPLCSSSYKSPEVIQTRSELIQSELRKYQGKEIDALKKIHQSHLPEKSAYSICMHRNDAHTVSMSHIRVTEDEIQFFYINGNPCDGILSQPVSIKNHEKLFI